MIVAWQGWRLEVPDRWGPVRIEGDADAGYLLMADLHRPRLGLRWKSAGGKRFKADVTVTAAMRQEIGQLATEEARPASPETGSWQAPLLFEDQEPPGRDVWVAYSPTSGRVVELVYHAHRRDRVLQEKVLPTLVDSARDVAQEWSIFDLSCRTPAGMALAKHRLNAGDLSLTFGGKGRRSVTVRQIAMAKLALQRRPMERWIAEQAAWRGNQFKLAGSPEKEPAGLELVRQQVVRRRRFTWAWWLAKGYVVLARHDQERDRLVIVDATDEVLAREMMGSIGWARTKSTKETEETED